MNDKKNDKDNLIDVNALLFDVSKGGIFEKEYISSSEPFICFVNPLKAQYVSVRPGEKTKTGEDTMVLSIDLRNGNLSPEDIILIDSPYIDEKNDIYVVSINEEEKLSLNKLNKDTGMYLDDKKNNNKRRPLEIISSMPLCTSEDVKNNLAIVFSNRDTNDLFSQLTQSMFTKPLEDEIRNDLLVKLSNKKLIVNKTTFFNKKNELTQREEDKFLDKRLELESYLPYGYYTFLINICNECLEHNENVIDKMNDYIFAISEKLPYVFPKDKPNVEIPYEKALENICINCIKSNKNLLDEIDNYICAYNLLGKKFGKTNRDEYMYRLCKECFEKNLDIAREVESYINGDVNKITSLVKTTIISNEELE